MIFYKPKKSREIYDEKIAHRGFHLIFPENTLSAYEQATEKNLAIELDVRITLDGYLVCMHDRYTKRLLGVKGKTSNTNYSDLKREKILGTDEKIPLLKDVLKIVNSRTTILIEVKGFFNKRFKENLKKNLEGYNGKIYFHAKNIFTYISLSKLYPEKVFWVLNPLRRRFDFIKGKEYKKISKK